MGDDDLWEIVAGSRNGILATINPDGLPHLTNVYYLVDPATRVVRVSTTSKRAKGRNLLRDPRAVLHVPGPDFVNFAVAEGDVTLSVAEEPGDEGTDQLFEVHSQLTGESYERPAFDEE